jgi:fructuronate reductase
MLNGAHSLMAYAGLARGHTFVHEAVKDPELRLLVEQLMAQAGATLPPQMQEQVPAYAKALLARFESPELAHRLDQIAMDGSQKVAYRFIGTLRDAKADAVIEGVRAWIAFCITEVAEGRALRDAKATQITKAVHGNDIEPDLLALVGAADLAPLIRV